ncbi:MAG: hypothetical protein ACYC5Q_04160 [Thermoleophilia bacterium]
MTIDDYDPQHAPDPDWWLALDEQERINLARDHHRRARVRLPNAKMHAVFHAVVETQVAMGDELSVARTLDRLRAEGLDRHDALHAIGSVLARRLHAVMTEGETGVDRNEAYRHDLDELTAEGWTQDE